MLGFAWSKQREIAESVRDNRRTAVQSCHDVGKDWIAAQIVAWWLSCFPASEAFAVTIAPTFHQVRGILWREINRAHAAGGLPGKLNQTEWWHGNELVGFGRSPADTDPTAIQGIHAPRVLFVGDEAGGLAKALLDAGDSMVANEDSRALMIGNPDDPTTEFANICKPGSGWNVIRISAFDSPNFTGEKIPDSLRPLLISKTWVEEKRKSWGEGSMLWSSKILGLFPEQSTDSLIPITAIRAAHARFAEAKEDGPNELGVDVARFGDDKSIIYRRKGFKAWREDKLAKRDTMEVAGAVVRACRKDKPTRVKIDDTGLGGGVTDRLRELQNSTKADDADAAAALKGVEIVPINAGESPLGTIADERFKNKRAEMNWAMRILFTEENARIALDVDDELDAQCTQIKYKLTSSSEIQIESKADMKKRTGGVSPDEWDALVLAFAAPSYPGAGLMEYYARMAAEKAKGEMPKASGPATLANGGVRLKCPDGTSTVYGMSGTVYQVEDGMIVTSAEDAKPLIGQGFEKA